MWQLACYDVILCSFLLWCLNVQLRHVVCKLWCNEALFIKNDSFSTSSSKTFFEHINTTFEELHYCPPPLFFVSPQQQQHRWMMHTDAVLADYVLLSHVVARDSEVVSPYSLHISNWMSHPSLLNSCRCYSAACCDLIRLWKSHSGLTGVRFFSLCSQLRRSLPASSMSTFRGNFGGSRMCWRPSTNTKLSDTRSMEWTPTAPWTTSANTGMRWGATKKQTAHGLGLSHWKRVMETPKVNIQTCHLQENVCQWYFSYARWS